ncbi:MAG: hypothetical protein J1E37_05410 [Prevotella sp.]|nr:hypothetical protein [Prevotella sp.]
MKKRLFGCMMVLATLLTTSCSSDLALEAAPDNRFGGGEEGEEVEVTFSVSSESIRSTKRAAAGPGAEQTISKGKEIDMLIYAVYDDMGNLLTQYGTNIPEIFNNSKALYDDSGNLLYKHEGQAIVHVGDIFPKGETYTLTLRMVRNKQYSIAFWAQSSKTDAYNTEDLKEVTVNYNNAKNNDELRDAFCKVESFSVSTEASTRTIILYRPFAQINVGTTGADYNHLLNGKNVFDNKKITKSKITLNGVATKLNVVTNTVLNETTTATFEFNDIPAYINGMPIPTDNAGLLQTEDEEFLKVDLDYDGDIKKYKTDYPTRNQDGTYLTETFKYLSMCYALVPASKVIVEDSDVKGDSSDDDATLDDAYTSSTLGKVEVSFAQEDGIASSTITLNQVPVHRNWRTNILGGLYNTNDNDDPNDPTSVFKFTQIYVDRDPLFDGEYNTTDMGGTWIQNPDGSDSDSGTNSDTDPNQ